VFIQYVRIYTYVYAHVFALTALCQVPIHYVSMSKEITAFISRPNRILRKAFSLKKLGNLDYVEMIKQETLYRIG
jgi:hypothetical protein